VFKKETMSTATRGLETSPVSRSSIVLTSSPDHLVDHYEAASFEFGLYVPVEFEMAYTR
jgi:hypothetical protein